MLSQIKLTNRICESYGDKLNYGELIAPGLMLMRDGALLGGWEFNGPDLESASSYELNSLVAQINSAFLHLGDGWMLHQSIMRFPALCYPGTGAFPDPTTLLFDLERKQRYEKAGALFENVSSLILTYKAPDITGNIANSFFIEGQLEENRELNRIQALFFSKYEQIEATLSSVIRMSRMGDSELITTLHAYATGLDHPLLIPNPPVELNYYIASQDLITGFYPRIGEKHFAIVGVTGFPSNGMPELLAAITRLPMAFRISSRFIFCDSYTAEKKIDRKRAYWEQKRMRISDIFARSLKVDETGHIDQHADLMMRDALEAQAEAASGHVRYGHFTLTVILSGDSRNEVIANASEVRKELQNRGLNARIETFNAIEAFLGSLPGHGYYDVRKPILHTMNVAHLAPFSTVWAGDEHHPSPMYPAGSPALMYCVANGHTPFRFNTFADDVGSAIVIGPTGSGKTVLLNTMALQDFRYPDMQVFYFDKDYGAYVVAKAAGGVHYDLLGESKSTEKDRLSLYPLGKLNSLTELTWAADWIEMLISQQGLSITPEQRGYIIEAVMRLSQSESKTLTELLIPQDKELQTALKYYQLGGASGGILDGNTDALRENRFQVFEQSHLLKKGDKLVVPTLSYIFHQIENRMDGRPTKIYIDEAWVNLMNALSLEQVEDWLRTIRKKNGALVLATQSLLEITNSTIRDLILESCPTKIFLPNPEALNPSTRKQYESVGLTDRQIEIIATAVRKRDYYFVSSLGQRLFSLDLGAMALSLVGVNGKRNRHRVDELIASHGNNWPEAWFTEHKLEKFANTWRRIKNEHYPENSIIDPFSLDVLAPTTKTTSNGTTARHRRGKSLREHRDISEKRGDAENNGRQHPERQRAVGNGIAPS
jgi:type IV secretion system protein VirB4